MPARFITIRFSHYCEKARWALDRAGVAYVEEAYAPMVAWVPAWRAGGKRTVPVLVPADGAPALRDSTDILHYADRQGDAAPLFPAASADAALAADVVALEDEFDRRLGPAARRLGYASLGNDPATPRMLLAAGPRWQRALPDIAGRVLLTTIQRGLKINAAGIARSQASLDDLFARIATRLADGRRYLCGDTFTAADLTFAALAAPLTLPPAYVARMTDAPLSAAVVAAAEAVRATPAGGFAHRVYTEQR